LVKQHSEEATKNREQNCQQAGPYRLVTVEHACHKGANESDRNRNPSWANEHSEHRRQT
jgi:hypothetical protein